MFERYNEKARRAIFFARFEASEYGGPSIEAEHLLLGAVRAAPELLAQHPGLNASVDRVRETLAAAAGSTTKVPTSNDMPLSHECRRALMFAAEESTRAGAREIEPVHLLAGLLRIGSGLVVGILAEHVLSAAKCREATVLVQADLAGRAEESPMNAVRNALRSALQGERAHADSAGIFDGLSFELASKRAESTHTICELLGHMWYWQDRCIEYVRDGSAEWPQSADFSWPAGVANEPEWQAAVDRYKQGLEVLLELVGSCDLAGEEGPVTNLAAIQATAQHNSYHAGQVVLVRQQLGVWPPPGGGLTW